MQYAVNVSTHNDDISRIIRSALTKWNKVVCLDIPPSVSCMKHKSVASNLTSVTVQTFQVLHSTLISLSYPPIMLFTLVIMGSKGSVFFIKPLIYQFLLTQHQPTPHER